MIQPHPTSFLVRTTHISYFHCIPLFHKTTPMARSILGTLKMIWTDKTNTTNQILSRHFHRSRTAWEQSHSEWGNTLGICQEFSQRAVLPYRAGRHVGVMGCHLPQHRVESSIFMHFQKVGGWGEDRWLISIFHHDLHGRRVLEGSPAEEARVDVNVGCFHLQSVGLFGLKVQWLLRRTEMNVFHWGPQKTSDGDADGWKLCAFLSTRNEF